MKLTVILEEGDVLVGTVYGGKEVSDAEANIHAEVVAGPGQSMHEIEVPDEFGDIQDAEELHQKVIAYLPNAKQS